MNNVVTIRSRINKIYKRKVPDCNRTDTLKKYKTENERYNAILNQFKNCDKAELNNLQVLYECNFFNMLTASIKTNTELVNQLVLDAFTIGLNYLIGVGIFAIIFYLLIEMYCSSAINKEYYILQILNYVKIELSEGLASKNVETMKGDMKLSIDSERGKNPDDLNTININ